MKIELDLTPEQLTKVKAQLEGVTLPTPGTEPGGPADINQLFPRLGMLGESRSRLIGSLSLKENEERIYEVQAGDEEGSGFSIMLGAQSSNLGVVFIMKWGVRIQLARLNGDAITPWQHRVTGTIGEPPPRRNWFGGNSSWNQAQPVKNPFVDPGEVLLLKIKTVQPADFTVTYHGTGPK